MEDKLQQAINKLDKEAEESQQKDLHTVADLLIQYITNYPSAVDNILVKDKSLTKGFSKVRDYAKKNAVRGCCYVAPEKAIQMIFDYYDIAAVVTCSIVAKPAEAAEQGQSTEPAPKEKISPASVSINLDDFF